MSALLDFIGQFGNAVTDTAGVVGGGFATYVGKKFVSAERNARRAIKIAEEAKRIVDKFEERFESLQQGVRLEIANFKNEMFHGQADGYRSASRPDLNAEEYERRFRDIQSRIEELRSDVNRERGARHALQKQIADEAREDSRQWLEIQKMVSRIDGAFEVVKTQFLRRT